MGKTIILSSAIQRIPELETILEPIVTKQRVPAKEVLNLPADSIGGMYYLYSGRTRHSMISTKGTEKLLYFLSAGWLFGESLFLMNRPTELYTVADTDLEYWKIDAKNCRELLKTCSLFNDLVMRCMCVKLQYLHQELESLCFDSCKERLLHVLLISADNEKLIDGAWYNLKTNFSHYDLAVQVGSVRVTVSKLIKELCDEGALRTVNRKIQISAKVYRGITQR